MLAGAAPKAGAAPNVGEEAAGAPNAGVEAGAPKGLVEAAGAPKGLAAAGCCWPNTDVPGVGGAPVLPLHPSCKQAGDD